MSGMGFGKSDHHWSGLGPDVEGIADYWTGFGKSVEGWVIWAND